METVQDLIKKYRDTDTDCEFTDAQIVGILKAFYKAQLGADACDFDFVKKIYTQRLSILKTYKQ